MPRIITEADLDPVEQPVQQMQPQGFRVITEADLDPVETAPQIPSSPNFFQRMSQDATKRYNKAAEIGNAYYNKEQTNPETVFQAGTNAIGALGDVAGNIIGSGARYVDDLANYAAPETYQTAKENLGQAANYVVESKVGELAKKGVNAYENYVSDKPRAKRNFEAAGTALTLLPINKALPAAGEASLLGKTGQKLENVAEKQKMQSKSEFVKDLILPDDTLKERQRRVADTGINKFRTKKYNLNAKEQEIAKEVSEVKGVSKNRTLQENYNFIEDAKNKEAANLDNILKKSNIDISIPEYHKELDSVLNNLAENPLITGDAEVTGIKLINKMKEFVDKNPSTASGLLQARKDLDNWVRSQKGEGVFDPAREGALSISLREVRQATNNFIDSKATNVFVKRSLRKQSNLYSALDNIQAKAAKEADTAIGRLVAKAEKAIPAKHELAKAALILGGGGAALASGMAPAVGALGAGIYFGKKAATNPALKTGTGKLFKGADKLVPRKGK